MKQLFSTLLPYSTAFAGFAQCLNIADLPSYDELTAPAITNGTVTMSSMRQDEYLPRERRYYQLSIQNDYSNVFLEM